MYITNLQDTLTSMSFISWPNSIIFRALYRHVFFLRKRVPIEKKVANNMQLANIVSLIYRHPMSTHFLRATFHHFLNALLKQDAGLKSLRQTDTAIVHSVSYVNKITKR